MLVVVLVVVLLAVLLLLLAVVVFVLVSETGCGGCGRSWWLWPPFRVLPSLVSRPAVVDVMVVDRSIPVNRYL